MNGPYDRNAIGIGRVTLGRGLQWVSGDSVHDARIGEVDSHWVIIARALGSEKTEFRASISVEKGGGGRDEMDAVLPLGFSQGNPEFGVAKEVRAETVRYGQRYRYGGEFLVPIDAPEEVGPGEIVERSSPRGIAEIVCTTCPRGESAQLPYAVFLDAAGKVRSLRYLRDEVAVSGKNISPEMIASAEKGIRGWAFNPGRTKSKSIADWCLVRVKVRGAAPR